MAVHQGSEHLLWNYIFRRQIPAKFINDVDIYGYQWDVLLDQYAEQFGKDHVYVFPYEDLLNDTYKYYINFFRPIGIHGNMHIIDLPVVNPGLSTDALELIRQKSGILDTHEQRKAFRATIESQPAYLKSPTTPYDYFTDEQRADLLNRYRDNNIRLFEHYIRSYDDRCFSTWIK